MFILWHECWQMEGTPDMPVFPEEAPLTLDSLGLSQHV